jgi:LysR family transcriptional regulator, low CO2-responsive transcriptional regulator
MITRFQASYLRIVIHFRGGNRRQIIDAHARGEIDIAIMGQPPESADGLSRDCHDVPIKMEIAPHLKLRESSLGRPAVSKVGESGNLRA